MTEAYDDALVAIRAISHSVHATCLVWKNPMMDRFILLTVLAAFGCCPIPCRAESAILYTGVNLAGAEFGDSSLPGVYNTHYTYPRSNEVDYFIGKGMNTFRLPFRWERLQQ